MICIRLKRFCLFALAAICMLERGAFAAEVSGTLQAFHTVTITVDGPLAEESGDTNPFTAYELTAQITQPDGTEVRVPGFFAADGDAANSGASSGSKWRVRFSPPTSGEFQYELKMKTVADGESIDLQYPAGEFSITPSTAARGDFRSRGRLQYVGERYLRWSHSGKPYIKIGADSPETLLGYSDFDGTWHDKEDRPGVTPGKPIQIPSLKDGLHRYPDHVADWREGDPTWRDGLGKGLIGGMNYLADQGVNTMYFVVMNVGGDGRNVWPWTEPTAFDRFDCSKLDQWEIVFEHMQSRGIQMHVVLQEMENDYLLDDGDLGPNRKLYLRELIARFAHHPAIAWNLGEENLQTRAQQQAMAEFIREMDIYDHPIAIHNDHWSPDNLRSTFDELLDEDLIDITSIQDFHYADVHSNVRHYVRSGIDRPKPWVVCTDELGGAAFGTLSDDDDPEHFLPRSKALWGNLMAGGAGLEWYFGWKNNGPDSDLSTESWRNRENIWRQSKIARSFFEEYLPFDQMIPADEVTLAHDDYCFAKPGEVYCVYQPMGGNSRMDLRDVEGTFQIDWFDPRNGGSLQSGSIRNIRGRQYVELGEPPALMSELGKDWVALVRHIEPVHQLVGGRLVVEAEHFRSQTSDDVRSWYSISKTQPLPDLKGAGNPKKLSFSIFSAAAGAGGRTFLRCLPDTRRTHGDKLIRGTNFSPEPGKMAILEYPIHVDEPGRYYVWVRAFSTGSEDNGIHVGLDGQWPASGQRMQWCAGKHEWTWNCAQRTEAKHCGEAMKIFLDIETPGRHTISFSMREDGFTFDQFALSNDIAWRPGKVEEPSPIIDAVDLPTDFPEKDFSSSTPSAEGFNDAKFDAAMEYLLSHCNEDGL
ncbi:MAG: DUF5060 domain-containing protein, partial [Planctomycetota bacterium]